MREESLECFPAGSASASLDRTMWPSVHNHSASIGISDNCRFSMRIRRCFRGLGQIIFGRSVFRATGQPLNLCYLLSRSWGRKVVVSRAFREALMQRTTTDPTIDRKTHSIRSRSREGSGTPGVAMSFRSLVRRHGLLIPLCGSRHRPATFLFSCMVFLKF